MKSDNKKVEKKVYKKYVYVHNLNDQGNKSEKLIYNLNVVRNNDSP